MKACLIYAFLIGSALAGQASADLVFSAASQEMKAESGATEVIARFAFRVEGKKPVTISRTETDCGCTSAALAKQVYAPGESGEIAVTFQLGDRTGIHARKVRVHADDQAEPHELSFKTEIPVFARVQPAFVVWKSTEATGPKSIIFELTDSSKPVEGITVVPNHPVLQVEVRELVPGVRYEIMISPLTRDPFLTALAISSRLPGGKAGRPSIAYATFQAVTPPAAAQTTVQPLETE